MRRMARGTSHILEQMLGARSKIAALRILHGSKAGYSGSAIAKRAGMGLLAIQNALADLERLGMVSVERGAVEHRYRLNEQHYLVAHGLRGLFEGERCLTRALVGELRSSLEGKVVAAGLFGSFARGEVKAGSDIDLLAIVATLKDREHVSRILSDVAVPLAERYGLPVQAVILESRQLTSDIGNMRELLDGAESDWLHVTGTELRRLRQDVPAQSARRRKSA